MCHIRQLIASTAFFCTYPRVQHLKTRKKFQTLPLLKIRRYCMWSSFKLSNMSSSPFTNSLYFYLQRTFLCKILSPLLQYNIELSAVQSVSRILGKLQDWVNHKKKARKNSHVIICPQTLSFDVQPLNVSTSIIQILICGGT